jgi:hypothetical protein
VILPDSMPMGVILVVFFALALHLTKEHGVWGFLATGAMLWLLMLNFPNG